MTFTLEDARAIAQRAHSGQSDKLGQPYLLHVEAVAAGLADFDLEVQVAGMLHDVVEDSAMTLDDLRAAGVPERSLSAVELVSRNLHPHLTYQEGIAKTCTSRDATLVKISDNAHNSLPDRVAALEQQTGKPAGTKYADARRLLWAAVPRGDVEHILRRANPALLDDLRP
ncbi:HD domain-containing protein [Aeromicrobium sp.]|uniref:HD domain-containing protein n=1 Tax=Aeromicrobium sp. TaxID=1871063 RepID=UPI0019CF22C9|nr:HD domain-containing protein [Aeromicrobium sp.]MBC7630365.1 bifunctional (p)ppGpp synthetase/guanosine-3',5'-bis(diphosphate) 3'-pyrophosphohydrolase [Aeromicrobium sp.]